MTKLTEAQTPIAALFVQWRDLYYEIAAKAQLTDDDLVAETDRLFGLADEALALTPTSVTDLYQQIAMSVPASLDPDPDATDHMLAPELLAKTRAALGVHDAT